MIKISGVVITFNEEKNLSRCLESLKKVCEEVIVLDSYSTDQTQSIAESFGAFFNQHDFDGHIQQKNRALDLASHDYVLSLDADEELSEGLIREIQDFKNKAQTDKALIMPRLTRYGDFWVHHCGWYPDKKLRLVPKGKAKWEGTNPHDILMPHPELQVVEAQSNLLHYSYESITGHIEQTNKFTTIAAREAFERNIKSSTFKIVTRPILKFLKDYILKRGLLDGRYGLIICTINALSAFLKYSKIKELQEGKSI